MLCVINQEEMRLRWAQERPIPIHFIRGEADRKDREILGRKDGRKEERCPRTRGGCHTSLTYKERTAQLVGRPTTTESLLPLLPTVDAAPAPAEKQTNMLSDLMEEEGTVVVALPPVSESLQSASTSLPMMRTPSLLLTVLCPLRPTARTET